MDERWEERVEQLSFDLLLAALTVEEFVCEGLNYDGAFLGWRVWHASRPLLFVSGEVDFERAIRDVIRQMCLLWQRLIVEIEGLWSSLRGDGLIEELLRRMQFAKN